jgi:hypothetical protein
MKHLRIVCLLVVLSAATAAVSQGSSPAPAAKPATPAPQAQSAPQPPATVAALVERQVSASEKQIVEAAEAMPEDKYNFSPESLNIPGSDY